MRCCRFVLSCLLCLLLTTATVARETRHEPPLIPRPKMLKVGEGELLLSRHFRVFVPDDSPEDRRVAEHLVEVIRQQLGIELQIVGTNRLDAGPNTIFLFSSAADESLGEEGYELNIRTNSIILSSRRPAGLFYGVQTLRQMLPTDGLGGEARLPCLRILDSPRYAWRGLMLDTSRHFMDVPFIERTLDLMAQHKLNRFHWHLTDSQGWRLQIRKYPKLTELGAARDFSSASREPAFYTGEEVRRILAFARSRHIVVVPEIEMPSHCDAAIAAYPALACEGGRHAFCAGKEAVFEFLFDVLDATVEIFADSPIIHIGGDERPKGVWEQCLRCRERMKELNLSTEAELQTWFMKRITDHLAKHNRRAISWSVSDSDPYNPTDMADIGNDAIVQNWHGGAAFAARQGRDVVNSDNRSAYFDYPAAPDPGKPGWMPVLDLKKVYDFDPTPAGLSVDEAARILGGEACLWTEYVPQEKVDEQLFPRLSAMAEVVWSPRESRDFGDFTRRLRAHAQRLQQAGVRMELP
jgi:hexosaminidase